MSLKIIYGKAGSGKTNACFEIMEDILKIKNSNIIYMVPEQFSLQSERRIIENFGGGAVSCVDVLSFERLAQRVFSQVGPVYQDYIDDAGKQMLMQRVLIMLENKLTTLSKAAKNDDFAQTILSTISEFKRHNITPDMLLNFADTTNNAMLKFKLCDLALIYQTYTAQFNSPLADSEDSLSLLCNKIIKHNLFTDTNIIIDAFNSFAPNQLMIIAELLKRSPNIIVTLTTNSLEASDNTDIFYAPKKTVSKLFQIAIENNIEILPNTYIDKCKKYENNPELAHLEENYFKYPAKQYTEKTNNISIFTANNYYGEVENTAMAIIRLCRENNYRYRDIAVITRNLDTYAPLIRHIFSEYNVLFYLDEKFSALKHPFAQAILSLFDIVIHNWNYESLFKWLKSDFSGVEKEYIYMLENYVLAVGSTPKMWTSDEDWTFKSNYSDSDFKKINDIKNNVREPIIKFTKSFKGRKTVSEIATAFVDFLYDVKADEIIQQKAEMLNKNGLIGQCKAFAQAWNYVLYTIDQMVTTLGDEYITFEKFYSILKAGLSGCEIGQIPPTVDEVQVCAIDRFKSQGVKCVFIIGTNDGVFPANFMNEGLLSDADRKLLSDAGIELAEDTVTKQAGENYLIYSSITSAMDKLFFYYPIADNDGKGVNPSSIINRLKNIFPNINKNDNIYIKENELQFIEGVTPTFNKMIENKNKGIWNEVEMWFKENQPQRYNHAISALTYTNMPQKLTKDTVNLLYGDIPSASVSRAEQFNRCEYSYFLKYGLKAKPRTEYKIEPADAGTFMHEIIEHFSLYADELGWKNVNDELCKSKVSEITESVLKKYLGEVFLSSPRFNYLSKKIEKIMSTTLWNIVEFYKQSSFVPLGYEIEFGEGKDCLPPIEIKLENGNDVKLVGKVDRADIWRTDNGNFVSIVDYKSGSKDIDYSEILCGVQIQLPTYINAICKAISEKEGAKCIPAAMLYYKIDSPIINAGRNTTDEEIWLEVQKNLKMRGLTLENENVQQNINSMFLVKQPATGEQIERLCKTAYKKLSSAINGIVKGNISINPARISNKTSCDWCDYPHICQFDTLFPDNKYRSIRKFSREEFFNYVGDVDN